MLNTTAAIAQVIGLTASATGGSVNTPRAIAQPMHHSPQAANTASSQIGLIHHF
jgi:hypothetical protein